MLNGSDFLRISANLSIPYDQTKILDFGFFEEALFGFQTEVMTQHRQNLMNQSAVFFQGFCEDKDVIQVDDHMSLINEIA